MRGFGRRIGLAAALLSLVAGSSALVTPAALAAVVIDVPASQPTIQAGIDASTGQTVVVAPGTYHERIDFKGKSVEVRSAGGPEATVIDGGGTGAVVVFNSWETRRAVLRGFTVTGGGGILPPIASASQPAPASRYGTPHRASSAT